MRLDRQREGIRFRFKPGEAKVFRDLIQTIRGHYRTGPRELPPAEAKAWYNDAGCRQAGLDEEDTSEWIRQLHQCRSGRLTLLDSWIDRLNAADATSGQSEIVLSLPFPEAETFLVAINDHRLLLAARHGIGEAEMERSGRGADTAALRPDQLAAYWEMELLAFIVESMLSFLPHPGE